jgi:hypothetical protein
MNILRLFFLSRCWFTRRREKVRLIILFLGPSNNIINAHLRLSVNMNDEYKHTNTTKQLPAALVSQQVPVVPARPKEMRKTITAGSSSEMTG